MRYVSEMSLTVSSRIPMYGAGCRHSLCTLMKQDCKMLLTAPIGSARPVVLFRQLEAYGQWIVMYNSCKYSKNVLLLTGFMSRLRPIEGVNNMGYEDMRI
jgi:hypothetical protein